MSIEVGSFTKSVSLSTPVVQDVSLPFDPKTVILFATLATTDNTAEADDLGMSIGFANGSDEKSAHWFEEDGADPTNCGRRLNSSKGIAFCDPTDGSVLAEGNITMGTGKFTVTWTTNNAVAYIIKYFATTLQSEIGSFVRTGTPPNTQTISTTNVGRAIILLGAPTVTEDTLGVTIFLSIGFADGTSQCVNFAYSADNVGTSNSAKRFSADEVIQWGIPIDVDLEGSFGGFNTGPNGFDIDWAVGDATGRHYYYIMFYEGTWEVGNGTTKTSAGTKAYTTTIAPDAVLFTGSLSTSLDTNQATPAWSFGALDGTNEAAAAVSNRSGQPAAQVQRAAYNTDSLVCINVVPGAALYQARLSSLDALSFTMDFQGTPTAAARYFGWIAVKDEPVGPGGGDGSTGDTLFTGDQANKLYKLSGFTPTLKDSIDMTAVDALPRGISEDGTDTIWSGLGADRLYKQSGFTPTMKDSFSIVAVDTLVEALSWDCIDTLLAGRSTTEFYKLSGFTVTVKDSFNVAVGLDNFGVSWDGADLLWSGGNGAPDKLYLHSGFSATLKDSVPIVGFLPSDISWNGTNVIFAQFPDKLLKHSGFTGTVLDSVDVSAIDNVVHGIEHGLLTERSPCPSNECRRNRNRSKVARHCRGGY